jgi:alpha-amylase
MFADIDYHQRDAVEDVKAWGVWIAKELGLKGFRLDAVQHFSEVFTNEWVGNLREQCGGLFIVGEFWNGDREKLTGWLGKMGREFALYDAPLLYNFSTISTTERADLRKVFDKTLVEVEPTNAVVSHAPYPI